MKNKLQSKDLRIGNLVYDNHRQIVVDVKLNILRYMLSNPEQDNYTPILLTEEWHNTFGVEKNGFNSFEYTLPIKNNIDIIVCFNGDYVMLKQGKEDIVSIWNKDLTRRDMFVHEWQNLYSLLTNEELDMLPKKEDIVLPQAILDSRKVQSIMDIIKNR